MGTFPSASSPPPSPPSSACAASRGDCAFFSSPSSSCASNALPCFAFNTSTSRAISRRRRSATALTAPNWAPMPVSPRAARAWSSSSIHSFCLAMRIFLFFRELLLADLDGILLRVLERLGLGVEDGLRRRRAAGLGELLARGRVAALARRVRVAVAREQREADVRLLERADVVAAVAAHEHAGPVVVLLEGPADARLALGA